MNVKVKINEIRRILDKHIPIDKVYAQLRSHSEEADLTLAEAKAGVGEMVWSLPGNDWQSFANADDATKAMVAEAFAERKKLLCSKVGNKALIEKCLAVPDPKFIYFRNNADELHIALTAWAFKYPDNLAVGELDTWRKKHLLQEVNIGFVWNKKPLKNINFKLNGFKRHIDGQGLFHVDKKLPVGNSFKVESPDGIVFDLTVTEGQADYLYDLTKYFDVDIKILKDGVPSQGEQCTVSFDGTEEHVETSPDGHALLRLPLKGGNNDTMMQPQPACMVYFGSMSDEKTPAQANDRLTFCFEYDTPKPAPEPQPEPEPEPEPIPEPEPEPEPEPKHEPEPEPGPQYVTLRLLDYAGYPMPDLPFTLKLKKKGSIEMTTDADGCYKVPKEWLTPGEKMKVKIIVSPEYQASHDIHRDAKKKNNKK